MAFIPENAKWYLAEIVQELRVEDDSRNMVWRNLTLVRADSPEEAYQEALRIGCEGDTEYDNPEGKRVEIRFRGLSFLDVIHDDLENGAELMFSSEINVSEEKLAQIVRPKEVMNVFRTARRLDGPNVASGEIVEEAMRMIAEARRSE